MTASEEKQLQWKIQLAKKIIRGVKDPYSYWHVFMPEGEPRPPKNEDERYLDYRHRIEGYVIKQAQAYIGELELGG